MKIHLDDPNVGEREKEYLLKAVESNYLSTAGPFVPEFEERFANYLQTGYCVATQSGTAALHMALYELGIKAGDEVIVPALTFVATVNPVRYVGATPVFVDVDSTTWNMDPEKIEETITPRTRAIIPVHLYGNPCNMEEIMKIAGKYGLFVIEDATESLGALYRGRMTGTIGHIGCFSFNGNKIITTGGGGMIAVKSKERAEHIRFLVNQARDKTVEGYFHPEIGFNYRMTNLEAALGLAQLERLPEFLKKKRRFYQIYKDAFRDCEELTMQQEEAGGISSAWLSSVRIDLERLGLAASDIYQALHGNGIPLRRVFRPVVDLPPYIQYRRGEYKNARALFQTGLNLPSSTLNTPEMIEVVAGRILDVLWKRNRFGR